MSPTPLEGFTTYLIEDYTMAEKTLIIHGWSDVSASFQALQKLLTQEKIGGEVYFVDYESQEDNMTYNDIVDGIRDRLIEMKLINQKDESVDGSKFNVIVHSTGGLVVRHWLTSYYSGRLDKCPVKKIVMLAPANFGSPLAKDGKSFLGALVAGRRKVSEIADFLETGQQILDGLELGSSFQWRLAHKDLLSPEEFYSPKAIQTTVLVGIEDYKDFLRSFANKPGTDGTVVISGTQLDSVKFTLNFNNAQYEWSQAQTISSVAFGVLQKVNHSSIVVEASKKGSETFNLLKRALETQTAAQFKVHQKDLAKVTSDTYLASKKPKFEQFFIHASDEFGEPLKDFTLEFFVCPKNQIQAPGKSNELTGWLKNIFTGGDDNFSERVSRVLCCQFEKFSKDSSYRRFLVDIEELRKILIEAETSFKQTAVLCMKIWVPEVDKGIRYSIEDLKALAIYDSEAAKVDIPEYVPGQDGGRPSLFYPNTTTLIELRVNRFNDYVWVGQTAMTKAKRKSAQDNFVHVKAG